MTIEFKAWPKTPRLNRNIIITEKLDGTNGAVIITEEGEVGAQSRNRLITPGKATDNYGFAQWVQDNAEHLKEALGPGHHYGEWYGGGIARNYGLAKDDKRFALFNVSRYAGRVYMYGLPGLEVVPVLGAWGEFDSAVIGEMLTGLKECGSKAVPGFMEPEGIMVYHSASRQVYKVLIENDELPKGLAGVAA